MDDVHNLARKLRKYLPTAFPVQVRLCKLPQDKGGCPLLGDSDLRSRKGKKLFLIRISNDASLGPWGRDLILLHEYAHARCWSLLDVHKDGSIDHHHPGWGVAYAECWRVYATDDETLEKEFTEKLVDQRSH